MDSLATRFVGFANRRERVVFFGQPLQVRMTRRGASGLSATVGFEVCEGETQEQARARARQLLDLADPSTCK